MTTAPKKLRHYAPYSSQACTLFRAAAQLISAPEEWATAKGLHEILKRESGGYVGRPNYTFGDRAKLAVNEEWHAIHAELRANKRTTRSTATGLGQLLIANVDRYYPHGREGIGDAIEEAAGMLAYIRDRYGDPDKAFAQYGTKHEGY